MLEKINNFILKNLLFIMIALAIVYLLSANSVSKTPQVEEVQYDSASNYTSMAIDSGAQPMMKAVRSAGAVASRSTKTSKIVKDYTLSIEMKNTKNIKEKVEDEIAKNNGFIENFYSYVYSGNELAYNFNIRIPSESANKIISYFKTLGIVKNERTSSTDMGEQYTDNANRLKNLYARRDRLRDMMSIKTQNLSDVLAVDRELSNVQSEIESLELKNKKIDTDVDYSTINLTIMPEIQVENFNNSKWQAITSFKSAVNDFVKFGQKSIDYIFKAIVFSPVIIALVLLVYFIRRGMRKDRQ